MSSSGIPIIDGGIKPAQKQQPQYANSPIGQGVMENGVINLTHGAIGGGLTYNPATGEYMKYDGLMPGYSVAQEQAYQVLHPDYSAMAAQPQVIAGNWTPTYRSFQYGVPDYPVPQTRTPNQVGPNYSHLLVDHPSGIMSPQRSSEWTPYNYPHEPNAWMESYRNSPSWASQQPSYRPFMMPQSQTPYRVGPDYGRLMRPSMPQRMFRPQPQTAPIQHPQQPFNPFKITSRTPR